MIIQSFRATNILKYTSLSLPKLPERGLIGISGANEAGKSAIAEAMCLALYGRTFSVASDRLDKLVRWGEQNAEVSLSFESGGERYEVTRYIDSESQQSASLKIIASNENLASGPADVNDAIARITGFDFSQYVDAFYLAQKEFQAPHPQSQIMRGLLGIADLDVVADNLRGQNHNDQRDLEDIESEQDSLNSQVKELALDPEALRVLVTQKDGQEIDLATANDALKKQQALDEQVVDGFDEIESGVETALDLETGGDLQAFREVCQTLNNGEADLRAGLEDDEAPESLDAIHTWTEDLSQRLDRFQEMSDQARTYGQKLCHWLGEEPVKDGGPALEYEGETYSDTQNRLNKGIATLSMRKNRNRMSVWLLALAGIAGSGYWFLHSKLGEPYQQQRDQLAEYIPTLEGQDLTLLATGSAILVFLAIIVFFRGQGIRRSILTKIQQLSDLEREASQAREETSRLKRMADTNMEDRTALITQLDDEDLHQIAVDFRSEHGRVLLNEQALQGHLEPLAEAAEILATERKALLQASEARVSKIDETYQSHHSRLQETASAIEEETARRADAERMEKRFQELEQNLIGPQQRIRVRDRSLELIAGACRRVYSQFNAQMRDYLQRLVPLITDGRYQHLKIAEDFSIRVFSTDKNDFIDLEDLSSGTQRGILLAVRLAIAQALVDARGEKSQTLMLDEPFAFFDRERMDQALMTLPSFSEQIGQVWVISQEFDKRAPFDLRIDCQRGIEELTVE